MSLSVYRLYGIVIPSDSKYVNSLIECFNNTVEEDERIEDGSSLMDVEEALSNKVAGVECLQFSSDFNDDYDVFEEERLGELSRLDGRTLLFGGSGEALVLRSSHSFVLSKFKTNFNPAITEEEFIEDLKEKYGQFLPDDFPYEDYSGEISCVIEDDPIPIYLTEEE